MRMNDVVGLTWHRLVHYYCRRVSIAYGIMEADTNIMCMPQFDLIRRFHYLDRNTHSIKNLQNYH